MLGEITGGVLLELYDYARTGKYSDLEIRCNDDHYHVHRIVMCSQIKFFRNACSGSFKEADFRVIDLSHDDPIAVRSMIEFAYTEDISLRPSKVAVDALHLVYVYAIAAKYDIPGLRELARHRFDNDPIEELNTFQETNRLSNIIRAIYDTTPDTDRGLRDIIVEAIVERHAVIMKPDSMLAPIHKALEEVSMFTRDCFAALSAKKCGAEPNEIVIPKKLKAKATGEKPGRTSSE